MSTHNSISPEEAAAFLTESAPVRNRRGGPVEELILGIEELTLEDITPVQTRAPGGTSTSPVATYGSINILQLRQSHHRLAQILALGARPIDAARMTGYSQSRISVLQSDPAFQELIAHYSTQRDEAWAGFTEMAATLSIDAMALLRERMEDDPDKFTPAMLLEITKTLADRTGNAPVTKSLNVNITQDMGARMLAAEQRERAARMSIDG